MTERLKGSTGYTSTTVNLMGGARERMSRLRLNQELREQLDREPMY
jgi:hypothetical protein